MGPLKINLSRQPLRQLQLLSDRAGQGRLRALSDLSWQVGEHQRLVPRLGGKNEIAE
jgi:hypothetical protein